MTGPSAAVDSSSGRSRNSRCSCFAPAPGSDKYTRITPARSSRAPAPGGIPTVVVPTSTRLSSTPQRHDQRIPTSCLARPEKHLVPGHASSFGTVQASDVRNSLYSISADPLPGASGRLYFREKPQNDLWPIGKPVPVIRVGTVATSLPAITNAYRTRCQIRSHPDKPTNYQTQDCHN
jgi:hypothetical protein